MCHSCQKAFKEGSVCHSFLSTEMNRTDYCQECLCLVDLGQFCVSWKSKVKFLQKKKNEEERGQPFDLLKEALCSGNDEEAFVLGLYLAHKRFLILRKEIEEENERFFLYENVATEEILAVRKLDLGSLETAKIQENLAHKLR